MAVVRRRLDAELVRRQLADSRNRAQQLIADGAVKVNGSVAHKAATQVETAAAIVVQTPDDQPQWASRGAHKLLGALAAFEPHGLRVAGKRCLDAGASTGGFTHVLLERGAAAVIAVDVGYGQLRWELQADPRVHVLDRTNVRELSPAQLPYEPELIVGDLSFISLRLVLPALLQAVHPNGDLVLMVKPQFEVGKEALPKGGVVRDDKQRREAVFAVAHAAWELGWGLAGVCQSPLPGPEGNVEYFCWFRRGADEPTREYIGRV